MKKKKNIAIKIVIALIVLSFVLLPVVFLFMGALAATAADEEGQMEGFEDLVPITFEGVIEGEQITLDVTYGGETIKGLKAMVKDKKFTLNYDTTGGNSGRAISMGSYSGKIGYREAYTADNYPAVNENTKEYALTKAAKATWRGYMRSGSKYLASMPSSMGKIGAERQVAVKVPSGKEKKIKVIIANHKTKGDGAMDFILENDSFSSVVAADYAEVVSVSNTKGISIKLEGEIKKEDDDKKYITITGEVDHQECYAQGEVKAGGKFKADGYVGSNASLYGASGAWRTGKLVWPIDKAYIIKRGGVVITSPWGPRNVRVGSKFHRGVDIDTANPGRGEGPNTPTLAVEDGTVTYAGWSGGYGNFILISHGTQDGKTVETAYGHHYSLKVKTGDKVKQGEVIGLAGTTGQSSGEHLHFEIRINGEKVPTLSYFGVEEKAQVVPYKGKE